MLKTSIGRLGASLTLLLTSCSVPDWASESYNLPKAAYAISFLVAKNGELRQLNYQLQAPPESMASLAQTGTCMGGLVIEIENDKIVTRKLVMKARDGWAMASKALADAGDAGPVWPDFGNEGNEDLIW